MLPTKINIAALILFNVCAIYADNAPVFTAERRIDRNLLPLKLKDKTLFTYFTDNDTVITSFSYFSDNRTNEPGKVECTIPGILSANRDTLGNGKVVAATYLHSHFAIFDYKNCSSYSTIPIDDGKPYAWDNEKEIELVVPYYDFFDIFDKSGQTCLPCRYNDKGERIEVKDQPTQKEKVHRGYFLEPTKTDSGPNGEYLYGFSFSNGTAVVKILDSKYNTLKEHAIVGIILGHSILGDKFLVCYDVTKLPGSTECQMLNKDLSTDKTIKMHHPKYFDTTILQIKNLADGGFMVVMKYIIYNLNADNNHEIFIQQIHADGTVEPAINFDNIKSSYVGLSQFVTDSGEYCLVAAVDHGGAGSYALMKCVAPKTTKSK